MPHSDAVIYCYGIEFGSKASELFNPSLDLLPYFMKMHMTGDELSKRVDDCDDGLAELTVLHSVCSP